MNQNKTAAEPLHREIGGVRYVIKRNYKENSTEDAASKMARLIRNEAIRLMRDTHSTTAEAPKIKAI